MGVTGYPRSFGNGLRDVISGQTKEILSKLKAERWMKWFGDVARRTIRQTSLPDLFQRPNPRAVERQKSKPPVTLDMAQLIIANLPKTPWPAWRK